MTRADHWDEVYRTKADADVSWYQESPDVSLELLAGIDGVGSLVDVGGGTSRLVDALLERGWDVAVLDVSEAALDRARQRLGSLADRVSWVVSDVTSWRPPRTFDVWHDRAVFHFLTDPGDVDRYRTVLAQAVRPGGYAVLATFAADGPPTCSGLPVQRYDADALAGVFVDQWTVVTSRRHVHVTPWGAQQPFTWLLLRRT